MKDKDQAVGIEEIEEYNDETKVEVDEGIYVGGPSQKQIDTWKSIYGAVFLTEVNDYDIFIWRGLSRREFKEVMQIEEADAMYREEKICDICVLWPENYEFVESDDIQAGTPTIIAEQIMAKSGFDSKSGPIQL